MSTQRLKTDTKKPEPPDYCSAIYDWLITGAKTRDVFDVLDNDLTLEMSRGSLPSSGTFANIKTKPQPRRPACSPIDLLNRLSATPLQNRSDEIITFVVGQERMLRLVPIGKIHPCHYLMLHLVSRFLRWYGPGNHSPYSREVFIDNMYGNLSDEERKQMKWLLEAEFREPVTPSSS